MAAATEHRTQSLGEPFQDRPLLHERRMEEIDNDNNDDAEARAGAANELDKQIPDFANNNISASKTMLIGTKYTWIECYSASEDRSFYYNDKCGVISWTLPEDLNNIDPRTIPKSIHSNFTKPKTWHEAQARFTVQQAQGQTQTAAELHTDPQSEKRNIDKAFASTLSSPRSVLRKRSTSVNVEISMSESRSREDAAIHRTDALLSESSGTTGSDTGSSPTCGAVLLRNCFQRRQSKRVSFHSNTKPGNHKLRRSTSSNNASSHNGNGEQHDGEHDTVTTDLFAPGITRQLCSARRRMQQIDRERRQRAQVTFLPLVVLVLVVLLELFVLLRNPHHLEQNNMDRESAPMIVTKRTSPPKRRTGASSSGGGKGIPVLVSNQQNEDL
jgi:hypothetical protein